MTAHASQASTPPVPDPRPAPACPRCRAELAVIARQDRRAERLTAFFCPSVTCGYKLIVPA